MTENEAKETLLQIAYDGEYSTEGSEAFGMAIKALEECEQYREIGMSLEVVEEFKRMDKENDGELTVMVKSIRELGQYRRLGTGGEIQSMKDSSTFSGVELAQLAIMQMGLKDYEAIGTVEEFKALKEKEERFDRNIKMFNEIGLEIRNKARTCVLRRKER